MACAAIAAHQRCCLPGSLKTTDEGLKKKLAWLAFAGKNRGWENFSVPASRVFCAVRPFRQCEDRMLTPTSLRRKKERG